TVLATHAAPPVTPNPDLGGDPALEAAFFDGYPAGQPGYNAGGSAAGLASAQLYISDAGDAAYDAIYVPATTSGTPEYAHYYGLADDGIVREAGEAVEFANPPTAPAIVASGFVGVPVASGAIPATDDGARRYTGFTYSGLTGSSAFASGYVVDAIAEHYAPYSCG